MKFSPWTTFVNLLIHSLIYFFIYSFISNTILFGQYVHFFLARTFLFLIEAVHSKKLGIEELVKLLGEYLTSTDDRVRARGVSYLDYLNKS